MPIGVLSSYNNHYEDEFNLTCLFPSYLKDMSGTRKMTIFDSQS